MNIRFLVWIVVKNVIYPGRRLIGRYLHRRHARFDRRAGIHTSGSVSLQELGLSPETSVRYEATPVGFFHSLIRKLHLDYSRTVFIDFGAGKGRTLLLASHYPFRSIIGVEIAPALCTIANENIKKYRTHQPKISQISVICIGIDEFDYEELDISDHIVIYMYNPCSDLVLKSAMEKLSQFVARGASVTIIYVNPVWLNVLTNIPWLVQVRYGETFDDTGNGFMEYVIFRALPPQWKEAVEALTFQFGPWVLGKYSFRSISNTANPLEISAQSELPVLLPVTYQQMRDDGRVAHALTFDRRAIRYVPYRGKRFFVDIQSGSFDLYLSKFSAKSRNTLRRKLRHFADLSGGSIDLRCYETPEEIIEFRQYVIELTALTYQSAIGHGFPEDEEFGRHLVKEAERGRVRGFLLIHDTRPIAYSFCRTQSDVITYSILGHDPTFAKFSPGTVLLLLVLKGLFSEGKFRILDFGGWELEYKSFFATGSIDYVKVIWFPIRIKYLALVFAHYLVLEAWRAAAWLKSCASTGRTFVAPHLRRISSQIRHLSVFRIGRASTPAGQAHKARAQQLRP